MPSTEGLQKQNRSAPAVKLYRHIKEKMPTLRNLHKTYGYSSKTLEYPKNKDYRIHDLTTPSTNDDDSYLRRQFARRSLAVEYNWLAVDQGFDDRITLHALHPTLRELSRPEMIDEFMKKAEESHFQKLRDAIQAGMKACVLEKHLGSAVVIMTYRSYALLRDIGYEHLRDLACLLSEDPECHDWFLPEIQHWSAELIYGYSFPNSKVIEASPWLGVPKLIPGHSILAS